MRHGVMVDRQGCKGREKRIEQSSELDTVQCWAYD